MGTFAEVLSDAIALAGHAETLATLPLTATVRAFEDGIAGAIVANVRPDEPMWAARRYAYGSHAGYAPPPALPAWTTLDVEG